MVPGGGKYPTTPPWKLGLKPQNHPFRQIFYISIIASLEPKLLVFQSSTQQQSCKANKIGQFWRRQCVATKRFQKSVTENLLQLVHLLFVHPLVWSSFRCCPLCLTWGPTCCPTYTFTLVIADSTLLFVKFNTESPQHQQRRGVLGWQR